jgi:predicted peptidase
MGHSMGGTGTRYLGVKYSSIWAALGPIAPAASGLDPDLLKSIPDMPVVLVQGDADEMVPIADTRKWADKLKELKMTYVYDETPGLNSRSHHRGRVAECIRLFRQHSKPATH